MLFGQRQVLAVAAVLRYGKLMAGGLVTNDRRSRVGRRSSALLVATLCMVVALVAAAAGWGLRTISAPDQTEVAAQQYLTAKVTDAEVGSSVPVNVTANWRPSSSSTNGASGTVTTVNVSSGATVAEGDILYTVDLKPVIVARGSIPAFRDIAVGAEGSDVAQVQDFLNRLGYYKGVTDGKVGDRTGSAIKSWQKANRVPQTGIVARGDLIFLPELPVAVAFDTQIVTVGAGVTGGESVIQSLGQTPDFELVVTDDQAQVMPTGTRVQIDATNAQWEAFVTSQKTDPDGGVVLLLKGRDDTSICSDACQEIPVDGQTELSARVVTVETKTGLSIPTSAVHSDTAGATYVIGADGVEYPITVTATARGIALVQGLQDGFEVRLRGEGEAE